MPNNIRRLTFPGHEVCLRQVEVPTIRLMRVRQFHSDQIEVKEQVAVQWFGESERGNLGTRNWQFVFPLAVSPESPLFFHHPEWFRTVTITPYCQWPGFKALAVPGHEGRYANSTVIFVMTARLGKWGDHGRIEPSALLLDVVPLQEQNFGMIRPRYYSNLAIRDEEISKLAREREFSVA